VRRSTMCVLAAGLSAAELAFNCSIAASAPDITEISSNLPILSMSSQELADRGLRRENLGSLKLPTGKIVTADVLVNPERPPLLRSVAPGDYPVTLYRLTGVDPRVALAD
jgi:hypothetical protein